MRVDTLSGVGQIEARGARASNFWRSSDTGGGGRIALYYQEMDGFELSQFDASGGLHSFSHNNPKGGAGTIFLKTNQQDFGDLIVDNVNHFTFPGSTPLRAVGSGLSSNLEPNKLTNSSAHFPVPDPSIGTLGLVGLELNPNTKQRRTFTIIGNTATEIIIDPVDGDMTSVAGIGDSYRGVYSFNSFHILGGARVSTEDEIVVMDTVSGGRDSLIAPHFRFEGNRSENQQLLSWDEVSSFSFGNQDLVITGSTLDIFGTVVIDGDLTLLNNSILTHPAATLHEDYKLDLRVAGKLTVDSTSRIDASGKGYRSGRTLGNLPGSTARQGGSYGGMGAGSASAVYGDFRNPNEQGSGGGSGRAGGGLLRINAGELVLNGQILSNGDLVDRTDSNDGGSGGAIAIHVGSLSGSGGIEAKGSRARWEAGTGGGGRIAIYYDHREGFVGNINAVGGLHSHHTLDRAGAGTIFMKGSSQNYGDLIVDSGGVDTAEDSTPLRSVGSGQSSVIELNRLLDINANYPVPDPVIGSLGLVGLELNPNIEQNRTYTIIGNTETEIFTDPAEGDMTLVASLENAYQGVYSFDNLTITGKAKVVTDDQVLVIGNAWIDPGGLNAPIFQVLNDSESSLVDDLTPRFAVLNAEMTIEWESNEHFYQIQRCNDLKEDEWENVGIPTQSPSIVCPTDGDSTFFRILRIY